MWAKIITTTRTKDLNYFSLCAFNLFNTRVSQFELNYWNTLTQFFFIAMHLYSDKLKCQRQEYILLSPITHHIREFRKIHHFKTLLNKFQLRFMWTNSPPESPFQTVGHQSHSCKVLLWSRSWHVKHLLVCSQRCLKRNVLNWLEQVVFFYGLQLNNMWREKIEYSI